MLGSGKPEGAIAALTAPTAICAPKAHAWAVISGLVVHVSWPTL